ncbi:PREDICTED: uncharacterized protein LOC104744968 [Camelina sativa]|uniref:Uncharacterized protein LOC104744968 n=1 Tax=Camelina sativa TaxID=90675 RepID=A0ABM0W1M0_CAMSA|nr:PREDICTED: uncharacterized protein LOC104744968 [Camelina sativa]
MKKNTIVIDDVHVSNSVMDDDGCRRFMMNAINEHTCGMSERIDVPIICLDEDDNDDVMVDTDYGVILDHIRRGDNSFISRFEVDNGGSDTRKFKISTCGSKLANGNLMKNRVYQQGRRRKGAVGFKAGRVNVVRENIQRDNRLAERRKRRIAELEAANTSESVPLVKTEEDIQQRDNKVRKTSELKADALSPDPLVRTQEDTSQRHNTVSEGRKRKADELKSRAVPLVRSEEAIQLDNRVPERRMGKFSETKAAETSRVVDDHVERVKRVTELKDVDETSRSKGDFVGRRKKKGATVVDKDYMSYLTWLVDALRDTITKPMANLQKDPSDLDTLNESTMVPETDPPLVKVKIEQDLESWSDDSDIIVIDDNPFLDGDGTPFVASKKVVDLDEVSKEDDSGSCWFRKELMDVLEKPYDGRELKQLHRDASIHRKMIRCRELRKGRETDYETDELGQSYLESFPDFEKEYKLVDGVDKERALKLLRGFFFYLKYVSHDGVFKPWEKNQWWQP